MITRGKQKEIKTIDDYISMFPDNVQDILERLRETIRKAAPKAEETISYQMPAFKLNGNLMYFAAFKDHISLFPTSSGRAAFKKELSKYKGGKGTIQFPLEEPIPFDLVRRIAEFRVKENLQKKARRGIKRKEVGKKKKGGSSPQ